MSSAFPKMLNSKKIPPTDKPDSVVSYHLSRLSFTTKLYLPTPRHRTSSPTYADIHGISTHEVYPPFELPQNVVCSYHTFSPLPAFGRRLFSVTLSVLQLLGSPSVRWRGALCCPDFPHACLSKPAIG